MSNLIKLCYFLKFLLPVSLKQDIPFFYSYIYTFFSYVNYLTTFKTKQKLSANYEF